MEVDADVDPRWATGTVTFVERPTPNVAVYDIGGQQAHVTLAMPEHHQVVVLRGPHRIRNLTLAAQQLPNGCRVRVEPSATYALTLDTRRAVLAGVEIRPSQGVSVPTLTLDYTQLRSLKLRDVGRVNLRRRGSSTDPLDIVVPADGTEDLVVHGEAGPVQVSSLASASTGTVTVSAQLTAAASVETKGSLVIDAEPPSGVILKAADVAVTGRVKAAEIYAHEGQVRLQAGVAAPAGEECVVAASAVEIKGDAINLRVEHALSVVAEGDVSDSNLDASSFVAIRGSVATSAIKVTASEDGAVAVVAGGQYDPEPDHDPFDINDETGVGPLAGWVVTEDALVQDSSVIVESNATIVLGEATSSTIQTGGSLLVAGRLYDACVKASHLRCVEMDGHLGRLDVSDLVLIEAEATLTGDIETTTLVVQGATTVPSTGKVTVIADHVQLAGRSTGQFEATCRRSLFLGMADNRPAMRIQGGPVRLLADHRLILHETKGGARTCVALEGWAGEPRSEPDIVVETGAKAAVDVLGCSGRLRVSDSGELRITVEPNRSLDLQLERLTARARLIEPPADEEVGTSQASPPPQQYVVVELTTAASLSVERRTRGSQDATATLDATFTGRTEDGSDAATASDDADGTRLSLRADRPFGSVRLTSLVRAEPPAGATLDVAGPVEFLLDGGIRRFHAMPAPEQRAALGTVPVLTVADRDTRLSEARGDIAIRDAFLGRIHGPEGRTDGGPQGALRVIGLDLAEGARGGAIIGFDPTEMGYEDLQHLQKVQVVDAHPAALRRFARQRMTKDRAGRARLRARAEWMAAFLERTSGRATAGSSRAAARWAANRLHHRSLAWGVHAEGIERLSRYAHKSLGYSSKVWPPLLTWLLLSAAIVGARVARWTATDQAIHLDQAIIQTVLLPLSFLRLGDTVQVFVDPVWNTLAFVMTAAPLVYVLIAVRNVLREPGSG